MCGHQGVKDGNRMNWEIETDIYTVLILCRQAKSLQSCLTLCDPRDCSPLGSSVHGILQARILQWVAIPFSRNQIPNSGIRLKSPVLQADSSPLNQGVVNMDVV